MTKHTFLISSAITTKFGVYSAEDRLKQTLATIDSIKKYVPNAQIILVESSGAGIEHEHLITLSNNCTYVIDMTKDARLMQLYNSTENWDLVKNGSELVAFLHAIKICKDRGLFAGYDRVHKISGRYLLNDDFTPPFYDDSAIFDKIIIGERKPSQFHIEITQQSWQYMSRLWSWPVHRTDEIIEFYQKSIKEFSERANNRGYIDIEHLLAKFLDQNVVLEKSPIGVEGYIAPTGTAVKD